MLARNLLLSFVSRGFTKFWAGRVASRSPINRHAWDLTVPLGPWCLATRSSYPRLAPILDFCHPRRRFNLLICLVAICGLNDNVTFKWACHQKISRSQMGFTKSWVGQVALRSRINRHALDLTVSLDDQGH